MAVPKFLFLALFMLIATSCTSSTTTNHFVQLDVHELVAAALRHPLHPDPTAVPVHTNVNTSKPPALNLLRRDTVFNHHYSSHRHRIQELIRRDSTRVSLLTRRVKSGSYKVQDFGSDVASGLEEGSGEYLVRIGVGSPAREQFMVIDTGSDIVWVQCQPCSQCYRQSDPVFDPAESVSFTGVPCGSSICGLLAEAVDSASCSSSGSSRCRYEVSYGDGSYTKGTLALETLTFGPTAIQNIAIGCGHRNRGLFIGAAGLLGLGWGPMSFIGQLGGQLGGAFAYCLSPTATGSLILGRTHAIPVGAVWVPLIRNPQAPSFYYVGLCGLSVGGSRLPLPEAAFQLLPDGDGGAVVDTGTAVTRLPKAAYELLRAAFVAETMTLPRAAGVSIFDTCYDLSGYGSVTVPTVSLYFDGGTVLTLPARNYMIPVDEAGTFCFAFARSASGLTIVGNIQQEGIQVTVDSANGFLGFGPQTC